MLEVDDPMSGTSRVSVGGLYKDWIRSEVGSKLVEGLGRSVIDI